MFGRQVQTSDLGWGVIEKNNTSTLGEKTGSARPQSLGVKREIAVMKRGDITPHLKRSEKGRVLYARP